MEPVRLISLLAASLVLGATHVTAQSCERVSLAGGGGQLAGGGFWGAISGDGRYVAFAAEDGVLPGDNNGVVDLFRRDLATGVVERVSITANGVQPDDASHDPKLSTDGRYVAFSSFASNLAPSDVNGTATDIFVKDMVTGALEHVSVDASGAGGNGISAYLDLSGDGRYVTFYSYSDNLVPNDTNQAPDTFLFDRATGAIDCLSLDASGAPGGGGEAAISDDGRIVAYQNWSLLGSVATVVLDRQTGSSAPVATAFGVPVDGSGVSVSGDGTVVQFSTLFSLAATDADFDRDVYSFDVASATLRHVSTLAGGADPAGACYSGPVSSDGRFASFMTSAAFVAADTNFARDGYLVDLSNGAVELATLGDGGVLGDDGSSIRGASDNGQLLVVTSSATNLVPGDTNGQPDVFVRDRCPAASWSQYGAGLAGAGGLVPGFAMLGNPVIGTTPLVAVQNNTGAPTLGWLALGRDAAVVPTPVFGTLLLLPDGVLPLVVPSPAATVPLSVPFDIDLCGETFYLQSLLLDSSAPAGVAFTRGIELVVGG